MKLSKLSRRSFVGLGLGSTAAFLLASCGIDQSQSRQAGVSGEGMTTATPEPTYVGDEENLKYNNPFRQEIRPTWYEDKKVYHLDLGRTLTRPPFNVAEQYSFVYEDEYLAPSTMEQYDAQPRVPGQLVVFDSVPGDPNYSPIWHNNFVLVPRDYQVNNIRSVDAINRSGYRVVDSPVYVN
ncbi:MAG: hypothetical protein HYY30_08470 [Chloroflexi bacterium]|nr:hypothetical protein [Chloroflexota bacterium]